MAVVTPKKHFQTIIAKGMKAGHTETRDWFRDKAMQVTRQNTNVNRLMEKNMAHHVAFPEIGKMSMFLYDPKHKETLPYYDRFPMIFAIEYYASEGSFLGINLHYLPPLYRARLMDALHDLTNNKLYDQKTKLKISYEILKGASKYKYFKPCIKKYLFDHVRSPFLEIPPDEWDYTLMLPLDRFMKKNARAVWDESKKIIQG